ncbi:MAG: DUF3795 domain-containing protein [Clostridia bacterium]|nr:DUF3795 domain-containing protein [Clostridia bacterium]
MFVSLRKFAAAADGIVPGCTVWLTGSASVEDYREGWSDLDLLILTEEDLTPDRAEKLLVLRQAMADREPGNPYYSRIEGGAVSADGYGTGKNCLSVYWGTTGQRIEEGCRADVFTLAAMDRWILLHGKDVRNRLEKPSPEMLYDAVKKHAGTIREHGTSTKTPMYRCGWMLDMARCLYTLKTGRVISKTGAGKTALRLGWCPDGTALRDALAVRCDPKNEERHIPDSAILGFLAVLEEELARPMVTDPCYCGHDCGRCMVRCGDPRAAEFYRDEMGIILNREELHCSGGRSDSVMALCGGCPMRSCCRKKGIPSCIDCEEPCRTYLDYAEKYVNRMGQV